MREYDQRLLDTVYMALGGTFVMWTLINIAAYLTNRRDKEALLKEIQDKTMSETIRLNGEITAKANALDDKISSSLTRGKNELEQLVEAKAKNVTENLTRQITSVSNALELNLNGAKRDLREIEYIIASLQARDWLEQKVKRNALTEYEKMLSVSIRNGMPWRISRDLEGIQSLLKTIPANDPVKPGADDIRELELLLAKVPKEHETAVSVIRKLLQQIAG